MKEVSQVSCGKTKSRCSLQAAKRLKDVDGTLRQRPCRMSVDEKKNNWTYCVNRNALGEAWV